ncbi:MAG: leucine-rich repeat domain-containing protein [Bacilli bacterium]
MEKKIQTISKFVENLLANYPTYHEEVGEILSSCHISSKLNPISSFDTYNPPIISWIINGSQYTPLDQFEIKFYDIDDNEIYSINNINTTKAYNDIFQYEISNSEWNNILTILGDSSEFGIEIYCYNTTSMLTGPYPSNRVICDTPYFFDFMLDETTNTYTINGITNVQSDDSVIIPNYYNNKKITKINDSAFLNCTQLSAIELPLYLEEIGSSVFKECSSLSSITIPSSVQYIDDSAFENCVSLVSVIVEREISNITNLGNNVFDGCSTSLQIVVPQDRVAEYKNKVYWSSYKSKIISDNDNYDEIDLYCLIDEEESITLNAGYNKLYKLVADCTRSYKFVTDVASKIIVYNSDMTNVYSGDNSLTAYLNKGTYYLSIEHSTVTSSGTININYALAYPTDGISITFNSSSGTNILSGLHLTENNMYHARLKYTNYNGAGFYKFTLNAGSNVAYPEYAIQVYTDADRNNLLSMYSVNELNILAQSNENENIIYINLPDNGIYYIDVTLPSNNYSILTFNVESMETNNINYLNSLSVIGFNVIFENSNAQSYFEEVTISHRSEIQLDILTSGIINNNIKVYVFEKVRDPGYEPGINYYYIETVYIDEITSINRSPIFTIVLDPGTYYFGYAENEDNANINFALRRMVDYNMNMQGILVADPYYTGYDLGTEVLLNEGECNEYTITEGFTRNIYLMVEDRLRDPMSRLDYNWYSSNESVVTVTNYGTVLAMPVTEDTTVTIYAVLKDDPKIVYYRTFIVLNDVEEDLIEIELNMSYSYVAENGTYQLELNSTNCPYPMIQYYSWNIINDSEETVTMNYWGQISSTGTCTVLIVGTYNLNSRLRLYIILTIE